MFSALVHFDGEMGKQEEINDSADHSVPVNATEAAPTTEQRPNQTDDDWMEVKTKRNKRNNRIGGNGTTNSSKQSTTEQLDFQFDSELDNPNVNHRTMDNAYISNIIKKTHFY